MLLLCPDQEFPCLHNLALWFIYYETSVKAKWMFSTWRGKFLFLGLFKARKRKMTCGLINGMVMYHKSYNFSVACVFVKVMFTNYKLSPCVCLLKVHESGSACKCPGSQRGWRGVWRPSTCICWHVVVNVCYWEAAARPHGGILSAGIILPNQWETFLSQRWQNLRNVGCC